MTIEELEKENEWLKSELADSKYNYKETDYLYRERVKECNELHKENAKLRYALALLRWEHAHDMETIIDDLYYERPSSWRFYHKSKVYWFNKWQELKKKLKENK